MRISGLEDFVKVEHEDIAFEVRVERRERSFSCGEPRVRSFADSPAAMDAKPNWFTASAVRPQATLSAADESASIRQVIENYEQLAPQNVESSLGELTTNPYVNVNNGVATTVDAEAIRRWQDSEAYKRAIERFNPGKAAPKVQLDQFTIVLTDAHTASVQYHIRETLADGSTHEGSSASILVKGQDGKWRIAVQSEHPLTT